MTEALLFEVEDEPFALSLVDVREVLRAALPFPLPRAPFGCLGLLDVRGEIIPLLDLAVLLGRRLPAPVSELALQLLQSHVLVVERRDQPLGLLVDRVLEVGHEVQAVEGVKDGAQSALGRASDLVAGIVESQDRRALWLRPDRLVTGTRARLLARALARARAAGQVAPP